MQTVIVIDDEEIIRKEIAIQLRRSGYNVVTAMHTDEAKDTLFDHKTPIPSIRVGICHLIICDNRIREHFGNEGLDFAEQLQLFGSTIPFILFTSSPLAELGEDEIHKHHVYYASKDAPPGTLLNLAIRLLTTPTP